MSFGFRRVPADFVRFQQHLLAWRHIAANTAASLSNQAALVARMGAASRASGSVVVLRNRIISSLRAM